MLNAATDLLIDKINKCTHLKIFTILSLENLLWQIF